MIKKHLTAKSHLLTFSGIVNMFFIFVAVLSIFLLTFYSDWHQVVKAILTFHLKNKLLVKIVVKVIEFFVTFSIGYTAFFLLEFTIRTLYHKKITDSASLEFVFKLVRVVGYILVFWLSLSFVKVNLSSLHFLSGAIGLGVGLGFQKIASNVVSGMILLSEKSIKTGDLVQLNDGTIGFVRKIGIRNILIEAYDGREILVPNDNFTSEKFTNMCYTNNNIRVEIGVSVSYDSDTEKACEILIRTAENYPSTIREKAPEVYLKEFGESGVKIVLYFWVPDVVKDGVAKPKSDVMQTILQEFKANNIKIPLPQRDVWVKQSN